MKLEERFWNKVILSTDPDACWGWCGATSSGYGVLGRGGRGTGNVRATHVSVWIATGQWCPSGMYLCHTCDNPPCCNPRHLYIGTPRANVADAKASGRHRPPPRHHGEQNVNSKLSNKDVAEMRRVWRDFGCWPNQGKTPPGTRLTQQLLADAYSVTQQVVSKTLRRHLHVYV